MKLNEADRQTIDRQNTLSVYEVLKNILRPIPSLKEGKLESSAFSGTGTLISVSAAPHREMLMM